MDANYIKSILTTDDIISILSELGADYNFQSSSEIHFRAICHSSKSFKLYYYDNSKSLYCHRCGKKHDIFSFIKEIKKCDFKEALNFTCNICNIKSTYRKQDIIVDNWQKDLNKFLPNYEPSEPLKIYDKEVYNLFEKKYHTSWINDGITIDTMNKFDIMWYGRNAQIVIPVYDINGSLVGIHARNTIKSIVDNGLKYQPLKTLNCEYKFPTSKVLYGLYQNKNSIKDSKSAIICEAPKSCLQADSIIDCNNCVSLFGWNMQPKRRDMLLDLGVNDITIALDRQFLDTSGEEFDIYVKQVKKIANLFKSYCNVYVIYDKNKITKYKDSPFDCGKDIYEKLYNERMKI